MVGLSAMRNRIIQFGQGKREREAVYCGHAAAVDGGHTGTHALTMPQQLMAGMLQRAAAKSAV